MTRRSRSVRSSSSRRTRRRWSRSHARAQLDAAHAQKLRHKAEEEEQAADARKRANDEEVRRYGALAALGVDLTRYLCVSAAPAPDQHLRVELETPVHLKLSR